MVACELCGAQKPLVRATVEGVALQVCAPCGKYGNVHASPRQLQARTIVLREEPEEFVVPEYSHLLRQAREKRKMSQQQFAQFLQERESMVAKWEGGMLQPDISLARRLERQLHLKLVQQGHSGSGSLVQGKSSGIMTLGDALKVRKRN